MTPFAASHAFSQDPLTAAWLTAIALLLAVVVAVPLIRTLAAGVLFIAATVTRRDRLRTLALRVMPRIAHLIGGLIIGTAAVSAPAFAAVDERPTLASIDLDRDAGAGQSASSASTPSGPISTRSTPAPAHNNATAHGTLAKENPSQRQAPATPQAGPTSTTTDPTTPRDSRPSVTGSQLYVVRSGDTLWDIADEHLDHATNGEITEAWKAIWRANKAVIGDDPGLILPGQQLDLGALS